MEIILESLYDAQNGLMVKEILSKNEMDDFLSFLPLGDNFAHSLKVGYDTIIGGTPTSVILNTKKGNK